MSTGVNLGFSPTPRFVDVTNDAWFATLLGVPGVPDAIDGAKVDQARALVVDAVAAAIRDGLAASAVAVLTPDGSPSLLQLRADAVVGDHETNATLAAAHAAVCDRAHTDGVKVVYVLNLTAADGAPATTNDVVRAIAGLQAAGVEADAWIVDQRSDPSDAAAVTDQACSGGRNHVAVALRGVDLVAEETYGDALAAWAAGAIDAGVAVDQIAAAVTAVTSLADA